MVLRRFLRVLPWLVAPVAAAQPCGDRLDEVRPASARAGERVELHGRFAAQRGARRPMANLGGVNDLEVLNWGSSRIEARLPGNLAAGEYRVGIYCDGRPGPQRFLHSTDWLPVRVAAAGGEVGRHQPVPVQPARPDAARFEAWLRGQPGLVDELVWEGRDGPEPFAAWPPARRGALHVAFLRSLEPGPRGAPSAPPDNLATRRNAAAPEGELHQVVSEQAAEALYLDAVGHSLALEYGARLPWSLLDYPLPMREILLDGRAFFQRDEDGYAIPFGRAGMALPSPAAEQWAFLQPRIGPDRLQTIAAVLEWLRDRAQHFEGRASVATMQQQWQYPGYPPVARVLAGTPHAGQPAWPVRPRVAGCFGTAGFLRALLRSANIPVAMETTCAHYQVYFPSEDRYLSHGDDPYSGDFRAGPCPASRLLLDPGRFQAWFRRGPEAQRCANVGRAARELRSCP